MSSSVLAKLPQSPLVRVTVLKKKTKTKTKQNKNKQTNKQQQQQQQQKTKKREKNYNKTQQQKQANETYIYVLHVLVTVVVVIKVHPQRLSCEEFQHPCEEFVSGRLPLPPDIHSRKFHTVGSQGRKAFLAYVQHRVNQLPSRQDYAPTM